MPTKMTPEQTVQLNRVSHHLWSKSRLEPQNNLDMIFVCADGSVSCHKFILKSASPMIAEVLENLILCPDDVIHILVPDFNLSLIRKCLELIYTGSVKLNNSTELEKTFQFVMKLLRVQLIFYSQHSFKLAY
jgi:hypothetical protein